MNCKILLYQFFYCFIISLSYSLSFCNFFGIKTPYFVNLDNEQGNFEATTNGNGSDHHP